MKLVLFIIYMTFSLASLNAQIQKPYELEFLTSDSKYTGYDQGKKAQIKEAKMQVDYVLTRHDSLHYIFIVDGKHLPLRVFKDYKEPIMQQARNIHFVKSIDSIMGYPSPRKRMLILITTQD